MEIAATRTVSRVRIVRACALMLLVLSLPAALLAVAAGTGLLALPYELVPLQQRLPVLFPAHMIAGGLALLAVPGAIAAHGCRLHKLVGRSAAALVLIGGITALPVAAAGDASWPARAGFAVQAVVWMALMAAAVHAIRGGNRRRHMWLMLAVAAVTSAALWLRLASFLAVRYRLPFDVVYASAAWLSWLLPLAAVAILARSRHPGQRRAAAIPAAM